MASKELVRLARRAAVAAAKASAALNAFRDAFVQEYGHDDVADAIVDAIDYSKGDVTMITAGRAWGDTQHSGFTYLSVKHHPLMEGADTCRG